jgi:hypothetical protein
LKIFLPILILLISFTAEGQQNDYLVRYNGDTLFGQIELHQKRFVVTPPSGPTIELTAGEVKNIHSHNFKGSVVVPCILHIYEDNLLELELSHFESSDIDTVMVINEVYSTPKMNLYWGMDNNKKQYYFYKIPSDSLPIQLYVNYSLSGDAIGKGITTMQHGSGGVTHIEVQKGYVNQLRLIMGDCLKITEGDWEILDYRIYSLKAVIRKYNKCR